MFPPSSSTALMLRLWAPVTAALRELEQVVGLVPAQAPEGEPVSAQTVHEPPAPLVHEAGPLSPSPATSPASMSQASMSPASMSHASMSHASMSHTSMSQASTSPASNVPVTTSPAGTRPAATSLAASSPAANSPPSTRPAANSPAASSPASTSPASVDPAPASPAPRGPVAVLRRRELPRAAAPAPRVLAHLVDLKPQAPEPPGVVESPPMAVQPRATPELHPQPGLERVSAHPVLSSGPRPPAPERQPSPQGEASQGPLLFAEPAPQPPSPQQVTASAVAPASRALVLEPAPAPAPSSQTGSTALPLSQAPQPPAALPTQTESVSSRSAAPSPAQGLEPEQSLGPQPVSQRPAWRDLPLSATAPVLSPAPTGEPAPHRPAWSQLPTTASPRPTRSKPLALAPTARAATVSPASWTHEGPSAIAQPSGAPEPSSLASAPGPARTLPPASRSLASPVAALELPPPQTIPQSAPRAAEPTAEATPLDPITLEETLSDVLRAALRRHGVEL